MKSVSALILGILISGTSMSQEKKAVPSLDEKLAASKTNAIAFLKSKQAENGSWGTGPVASGMTGIVVTGLIKAGVSPEDPVVARALKYIESLVDEKEGHIAGAEAKVGQFNYPTCVNIMALTAADPEGKKYKTIVEKAAQCLIKYQWGETQGKTPADVIFGGAGYGGGTRPDLSNTHFFLDAIATAKVPNTHAAYKNAALFVSRCQNFKSEFQDQPWAGKINDGSFIYTAAGDTRGALNDDGTKPGYGSMTYAGLKCLLLTGASQDDPRVKKALEWLAKNYTVDVNPGMPEGSGPRGLYYYLLSMARALEVLGGETFTTADGKAHFWRKDITNALLNRQAKDGSWSNDISNWMEADPVLCTAYSLITLSKCVGKN